MSKPINKQCQECSKLSFRKSKLPECYVRKTCAKKRCYYRKIDYYRDRLRHYHRYLKFLGNKCFVCGSVDALEAHHIIAQINKGIDNDDNIVTLCHACHKIITIYHRRLGLERKLK
jgi:5-methylcytosine-specific restriction endonuclease McrA